eukprot:Rmarinus@m.10338
MEHTCSLEVKMVSPVILTRLKLMKTRPWNREQYSASDSLFGRWTFFGASKYVWAVTTVETLGLYRIEDSRQLAYFKSAREEIGGLTCLPDEEDATASSKYEPGSAPVDYVLSCYCKEESGRLYLASGKNNGDLILAHVNLGRFSVQQLLTGGHDTIVRTCCWNNDGSVMITGDEHAQLTAWRLSSSCPASHSTAATRKDLQKERVQRRKAPY